MGTLVVRGTFNNETTQKITKTKIKETSLPCLRRLLCLVCLAFDLRPEDMALSPMHSRRL